MTGHPQLLGCYLLAPPPPYLVVVHTSRVIHPLIHSFGGLSAEVEEIRILTNGFNVPWNPIWEAILCSWCWLLLLLRRFCRTMDLHTLNNILSMTNQNFSFNPPNTNQPTNNAAVFYCVMELSLFPLTIFSWSIIITVSNKWMKSVDLAWALKLFHPLIAADDLANWVNSIPWH